MKKPVSILLLFVFFLFQGGRILLYLECRFSNSITTSSCDCNKILADNAGGAQQDTLPVNNHAAHKHFPEEFELYTAASLNKTIGTQAGFVMHNTSMLPQDFVCDVFHPPLI